MQNTQSITVYVSNILIISTMERVINDITTNHVKAQYYEQRQHIVLQPKFFCDLQLTNPSIECIEIRVQIFFSTYFTTPYTSLPPPPPPHPLGHTHTNNLITITYTTPNVQNPLTISLSKYRQTIMTSAQNINDRKSEK